MKNLIFFLGATQENRNSMRIFSIRRKKIASLKKKRLVTFWFCWFFFFYSILIKDLKTRAKEILTETENE